MSVKLAFRSGPYEGEDPMVVADKDPNYIMWAYENTHGSVSPAAFSRALRNLDRDSDAAVIDGLDNILGMREEYEE